MVINSVSLLGLGLLGCYVRGLVARAPLTSDVSDSRPPPLVSLLEVLSVLSTLSKNRVLILLISQFRFQWARRAPFGWLLF